MRPGHLHMFAKDDNLGSLLVARLLGNKELVDVRQAAEGQGVITRYGAMRGIPTNNRWHALVRVQLGSGGRSKRGHETGCLAAPLRLPPPPGWGHLELRACSVPAAF